MGWSNISGGSSADSSGQRTFDLTILSGQTLSASVLIPFSDGFVTGLWFPDIAHTGTVQLLASTDLLTPVTTELPAATSIDPVTYVQNNTAKFSDFIATGKTIQELLYEEFNSGAIQLKLSVAAPSDLPIRVRVAR